MSRASHFSNSAPVLLEIITDIQITVIQTWIFGRYYPKTDLSITSKKAAVCDYCK
jgi:hypothetical protein